MSAEHDQGDEGFRGDLNPNAMRVMSRTLVLTDSVRPLDRPCSIAARIDGCAGRSFSAVSERRDPASAGAADAPGQSLGGLLDGHLEDQSQAPL